MLSSVKRLEGLAIGATDGPIGKVKDFYFDDQSWAIRYVVADTSAWLGREVLVSPYAISKPNWAANVLPVDITREQLKHSPGIDTELPVSRQFERSYLGYYGYPYYWAGTGLWGDYACPAATPTSMEGSAAFRGALKSPSDHDGDSHLRSCEAVKGYHVHASDGEIGHIEGFIVDEHSWSIRYLVVNTSNWRGHDVLVSPEWIQDISWPLSTVNTNLDREAIKGAPIYNESAILDRDAEIVIYNHYDRNGYWQEKHDLATA